jgi:hypothetical protein
MKKKINQYRPVLEKLLSPSEPITLEQVLELKKLIEEAEQKLQADEWEEMKEEIGVLKSTLRSLIDEYFSIKDLKPKLQRFLEITDKAIAQPEPMKDFAHRIRYLENFIALFPLSMEKLGKWEKLQLEMDIDLLDPNVLYLKGKFRKLLEKEEKSPAQVQNPAVKEFLEILKKNAEIDDPERSAELNSSLKEICQYLSQNPQLFSSLKEGEASYHSKEDTHLKFTVQIKHTENGFQLYVNLKRKVEDWLRSGSYKIVKKNLMLIQGKWRKGVDAVVYGEKDSKSPHDKIKLTIEECKRTENLDPLYVHKLTPAAAYTHKGQYKQSFVSELAEGTLGDIIYNPQAMSAIGIGELFILCYSMASSVAYLHSESVNLVHNDIKWDNFLVFGDEDGIVWVKISDLGLSKPYSKGSFGKWVDLRNLGCTWGLLLDRYAHHQDPKSSTDEIFVNLYSLCTKLKDSTLGGCGDADSLMKALNLVYEKLVQIHSDEAIWVKEKIEKFYGIKFDEAPIKEKEKQNPQGFFSLAHTGQPQTNLEPYDPYCSL